MSVLTKTKEYQKQWREEHQEEIKKYRKEWYLKNKEKHKRNVAHYKKIKKLEKIDNSNNLKGNNYGK